MLMICKLQARLITIRSLLTMEWYNTILPLQQQVEVLAYDDENSSDEDGMTEREMQAYKKQLKRMKQQSRKHNMGSDLESDTAQYGPDGEGFYRALLGHRYCCL